MKWFVASFASVFDFGGMSDRFPRALARRFGADKHSADGSCSMT
jgi:hypothetical protein